MAMLPDGWVFRPKMENAMTISVEQRELVLCRHCKHWIPGEIDDNDNFIPPRCEFHGGGWSCDNWCSDGEKVKWMEEKSC